MGRKRPPAKAIGAQARPALAVGFRDRGNKTWFTPSGQQVRSGYELTVLTDLERRGIPYEYEPDSLAIWLPVRGTKCGSCGVLGKSDKTAVYTVDVRLSNGRYIELKGKLAVADRTRLKSLIREWGDKFPRPLSLMFMRDNFITKTHKTRYSEWARSLGFDVYVGNRIPEEWLE